MLFSFNWSGHSYLYFSSFHCWSWQLCVFVLSWGKNCVPGLLPGRSVPFVFMVHLRLTTLSRTQNDGVRIWKETALAWVHVNSHHSLGGTGKNHENCPKVVGRPAEIWARHLRSLLRVVTAWADLLFDVCVELEKSKDVILSGKSHRFSHTPSLLLRSAVSRALRASA